MPYVSQKVIRKAVPQGAAFRILLQATVYSLTAVKCAIIDP